MSKQSFEGINLDLTGDLEQIRVRMYCFNPDFVSCRRYAGVW